MHQVGMRVFWLKTACFCVLALAMGCDGIIGGAGGPDDILGAGDPNNPNGGPGRSQEQFICEDPSVIELGSAPLRRLTNVEYDNTVRDLLGGSLPALPEQPTDAVLEGSFENNAKSLGPSDVRITRYETAAMDLGEHAATNLQARARVLPCNPNEGAAACGREFVEVFGGRAFRRPLSVEEIDRWSAFFEEQRNAIDFDAAVQLTVAGMLQSPQFLYRLEYGETPVADGQLELGQYEIANRLSYFLWESMPDDALFAAAEAGMLRSDAELEAQARRMLDDDRARDTVRNFHRQWLYLDRVLGEDKLPGEFPMWSDGAKQSAREESLRFLENTIFDGGTVRDLLTSTVAYVDDVTAELYGVNAPSQPWSQVELNPAERAGILSRVAFLAGNAHEANGSPPLRGVFVMDRILCEPRLSPPADADLTAPEPDPGAGPMTNRELFEERVSPANCQTCHVRIDGFGYGFEAYDAAGIYRDTDNGLPVDATGFANGIGNDAAYEGAVELQALLAESPVVENCVVQQWFTYAYGRTMEGADTCQVEALQAAFRENDGDILEMLVDMVTRPEFRLRAEGGS
ncbi:MAG: DUF1592 domain-containing protein [Myxococcota bacterium]